MTKNWADVRDVMCILYRKRYSLGTIQKRLEKEHQFKASIRSYRMKIAAWNIRHSECATDCGSSGPQLPQCASTFAAESTVETLQSALVTSAPIETIKRLLQSGASPNLPFKADMESIVTKSPYVVTTPWTFAVGAVCETNDNVDEVKYWHQVASLLAEYGALVESKDEGRILRRLAKWLRSFASLHSLYAGTEPLLAILLRNGLDPTQPIADGDGCQTDSLFHLAVFHSPNEALARLVIENSWVQNHGHSMLRCILHGCQELLIGSELEVDKSRELLRVLLARASRTRSNAYIVTSAHASDHRALLESLAVRKDEVKRHQLAEVLLQQQNLGAVSHILCADVIAIQSIVSSSLGLSRMLQELQHGGNGYSREAIQCIVHVVTKSVVQALSESNCGASGKLFTLLQLRQKYGLPDILVPNRLIIAASQQEVSELPGLDQSLPDKIVVAASQEDVPGFSELNQSIFDVYAQYFR